MNPYDLLVLLNDSQLANITEGSVLRQNPSTNSWVIERFEEEGYLLIKPNPFNQVELNLPLCLITESFPEGIIFPLMLMCEGLGGGMNIIKDDQDAITLCYRCVIDISDSIEDIKSLLSLIRSEYYVCMDRISSMRKFVKGSRDFEGLFSLYKLDNMLDDDKKEEE